MKPENPSNIGIVCDKHAAHPDLELAKLPPEQFVGKFVKLGFEGKKPNGGTTLEHMWVLVSEVKDGELVGKLYNDPVLEMEYRCGDEVGFHTHEIEAVMDQE